MEFSLLICNGSVPNQNLALFLAHCAEAIVCADGGANHAFAHGITPSLILGDLDSIRCEVRGHFEKEGVEIRRLSGQDDTDFEKALKHLRESGATHLAILGLTGGRLDHTLGNLSILMRYVNDFEIVVYDDLYRIDVIHSGKEFRSEPGRRVSLLPLLDAREMTTGGLEYSLEKESLIFGEREGSCNTAVASTFHVELAKGTLLVFRELTKDIMLPWALNIQN
jgi:thiamine pyrophosphokinase